MTNEEKTYSMVLIALFGAIISIISIIPTGIIILGVPATLQTFAIALTAYTLGYKKGTMALPYLPKDILSLVAAYMVAKKLRKTIKYIGME